MRYQLIKADIHEILRRVDRSLDELVWPEDDHAMRLGKQAANDLEIQIDRLHSITTRLGQHVLGAAVEQRKKKVP